MAAVASDAAAARGVALFPVIAMIPPDVAVSGTKRGKRNANQSNLRPIALYATADVVYDVARATDLRRSDSCLSMRHSMVARK
jgi:hypothetical protein